MVEYDITEALILPEDLTSEEQTRWRFWDLASETASRMVHDLPLFESPLFKYNYINKIYRVYLAEEGLKYDEERGL
jgi:hypothetical protein